MKPNSSQACVSGIERISMRGVQNSRPPQNLRFYRYLPGPVPKCLYTCSTVLFTPPEETEHGTRPGGRGPGGVPGGVGSKNRGGHVRVYSGVSVAYTEGVYPL